MSDVEKNCRWFNLEGTSSVVHSIPDLAKKCRVNVDMELNESAECGIQKSSLSGEKLVFVET